jgi:hypothetical protein
MATREPDRSSPSTTKFKNLLYVSMVRGVSLSTGQPYRFFSIANIFQNRISGNPAGP